MAKYVCVFAHLSRLKKFFSKNLAISVPLLWQRNKRKILWKSCPKAPLCQCK